MSQTKENSYMSSMDVHLEESAPCFSNDLCLEKLMFVSRRSTLIIQAVKMRWAFKRQMEMEKDDSHIVIPDHVGCRLWMSEEGNG